MSGPKVCIARGGARSRLLRSSALIPAAAVMVGASSSVFAQAVNLGHAGGNSIVPDGRTNTKLAVHGSVTDIRTSTFSGGNAYNSFSTFSEAAGNTVNLHVPHSANKLVNIVRNGAVNIQGTLNSYKNGKIGGNVVFADSYGFVVGKSGSINVGSLTVVTPSGATLDQVVDANGHVDQALATRLIAGNVPLSADGSVVIEGRVNAKHFVKITAQDVRVAGSMEEAKRVAMHRAQFESTVNTQGLTEGGSIVVRNGGISIVAGSNAAIGGKLRANGTASHAGSIAIAAKHNVSIAASAKLSATATRVAKHAIPGLAPSAPTITISAGDTATIAGTLSAQTTGVGLPGQIGITGTDISVTATARLVAQGGGVVDGGHISVKSTDLTTVAAGVSFVASALGTGNGGFVEISGKIDRVDAGVTVDLGAVTGKAGTLLFDPYDLYITGPGQNGADLGGSGTTADPTVGGAASTLTSFYTKGANIELDATNSITINGTIDTRQYASELATTPTYVAGLLSSTSTASTGSSGNILLQAPTITISKGGALYADVNNVSTTTNNVTTTTAFTDGTVTLNAAQQAYTAIAYAGATAGITIDGTITGASIAANANATAKAVYAFNADNTSPGSLSTLIVGQIVLDLLPINLSPGYVQSGGSSTITVQGDANLTASGNIALNSHTVTKSADPALGLSPGGKFLAAGVVVGILKADTTKEIASGAHVSAGSLDVAATNDATLDITSTVISGFPLKPGTPQAGAPVVISFVYGYSSVNSTAKIDTGAHISVSGTNSAVNVLARNDNSFTAAAVSYARDTGSGAKVAAGAAIAIGDFNGNATAHIGTDIGLAAKPVGSVSVVANDETAVDKVKASTTVGQSFTADILNAAGYVASAFSEARDGSATPPDIGLLSTFLSSKYAGKISTVALPKIAGAIAVSVGTETSQADLSNDSVTSPSTVTTAPNVQATGGVAIISDTTTQVLIGSAQSTINSSKDPTSTNPTADNAFSVGLAITEVNYNSTAFVGPRVTIDAGSIGVQGITTIHSPIEGINWTDYRSVISNLIADQSISTTQANATAASTELGLSGSVNYFAPTTTTTAWVGDGARLHATNADTSWTTADLSKLDPTLGGSPLTTTFVKSLDVVATSLVESINIGGDFAITGGVNATGGVAVGGSVLYVNETDTTLAGIAQGGTITSVGSVYVDAETHIHAINVAPTDGKGDGVSFSGLAGVFTLNDTMLASISSGAVVTAPTVQVNAQQTLGVYTITGDFSLSSGGSAVGASVRTSRVSAALVRFLRRGNLQHRSAKSSSAATSKTASIRSRLFILEKCDCWNDVRGDGLWGFDQ